MTDQHGEMVERVAILVSEIREVATAIDGGYTDILQDSDAEQLREAANVFAAIAAQQSREAEMVEAAGDVLRAFAEGVIWSDEQRAAYERLAAALRAAQERGS